MAERHDDPIARSLFEAAIAFSERRYSPTRAAAFEQALLAFGAFSAETLLTQEGVATCKRKKLSTATAES